MLVSKDTTMVFEIEGSLLDTSLLPPFGEKDPGLQHTPGEPFIRGPIPWRWVVLSATLPGKALSVALALWFQAMRLRPPRATISLPTQVLRDLQVSRQAAYRALQHLERAGLVRVQRKTGCRPLVTILPAPAQELD